MMTKRRIYLALTVEVPATTGEAEVEQAINSALDEDGEGMERAWGEWVVGAATIALTLDEAKRIVGKAWKEA